jgi:replicative DNA helicase
MFGSLDKLESLPLYFESRKVSSAGQVESLINLIESEKGHLVRVVFIDYLQLMISGSGSNRYEALTDLTGELKQLANSRNIAIVAMSQMNRAKENKAGKDKRPLIHELKESGSIEQDSDIVLLLHREVLYNPDYPNVLEVIVAKNRDGEIGTAEMKFLPHISDYEPTGKAGRLTRDEYLAPEEEEDIFA